MAGQIKTPTQPQENRPRITAPSRTQKAKAHKKRKKNQPSPSRFPLRDETTETSSTRRARHSVSIRRPPPISDRSSHPTPQSRSSGANDVRFFPGSPSPDLIHGPGPRNPLWKRLLSKMRQEETLAKAKQTVVVDLRSVSPEEPETQPQSQSLSLMPAAPPPLPVRPAVPSLPMYPVPSTQQFVPLPFNRLVAVVPMPIPCGGYPPPFRSANFEPDNAYTLTQMARDFNWPQRHHDAERASRNDDEVCELSTEETATTAPPLSTQSTASQSLPPTDTYSPRVSPDPLEPPSNPTDPIHANVSPQTPVKNPNKLLRPGAESQTPAVVVCILRCSFVI